MMRRRRILVRSKQGVVAQQQVSSDLRCNARMLSVRMRGETIMLVRVAAALLLITLVPSVGSAEKRVALVIGNGAYAKVGKLANPTRDADAIAALFRKAGFDVVETKRDLALPAMHRALRDFSDRVHDADIAAIFFAGHGIEVNGTNYLIPVDATLERDTDVEVETVSLERVTQMLEHAKRLRLIILDACRDNPFVRSMKRTVASRSIGRGLAKVEVLSSDTLIAFAAKHGSTAADGEGANSPYTTAIVKHLTTPGLDLRIAFGKVRDEVLQSTAKKQEPHYYGSLGGAEIALVPAKPQPAPEPKVPPVSEAAREWARVDKASVVELNTFVRRHGSSPEAEYARAHLEELKQRPPPSREERIKQIFEEGLKKKRLEDLRKKEEVAAAAPPKAPARPPTRCDGVEALVGNEKRCLKPKESFKDCPECPEMVVVPGGEFIMGSSAIEADRSNFEGPQHKVAIVNPLAVGRFAVTRGEFGVFVKDTDHKSEGGCGVWTGTEWKEREDGSWRSPGFEQNDLHPVVCMSWDDAKTFAAWLLKKTDKPYRLLSEAEREYVTRAGTTTRYHFGDDDKKLCQYANGADRTAKEKIGGTEKWTIADCDDGYAYTAPVGRFLANSFGLHDVHGNVWEWVEDCYHDSYRGAPTDGSAWTTGDCSNRVRRGGSWSFGPRVLRAAFRARGPSTKRYDGFGFRVVRTLGPSGDELKTQQVTVGTPPKASPLAPVTTCFENSDEGSCVTKAGACEWVPNLLDSARGGFCRAREKLTGVAKTTSPTPVKSCFENFNEGTCLSPSKGCEWISNSLDSVRSGFCRTRQGTGPPK